ncbi:MAG: hypothetical protein ACKVOR_13825 [Flavobacteriales bacterium]
MNLQSIKTQLTNNSIFYSEDAVMDKPSVIGYEKKFRWAWMATQMNTFVVATDIGEEPVTKAVLESHLNEAFRYAQKHYKGWPRGLQSGLAVISIVLGKQVEQEAKDYCTGLKSGKKWAAMTIPVACDTTTSEAYFFTSNPMWGAIYFPHFKRIIQAAIA